MNPVSLMANAEKLSVAQLQQAVKNGTVPAYIGIPMMQEKMKQAKQAQVAQAPTEPPIAQQVMAEASGIDQMPSNLPTQNMKDGGIVAFADGGDVDDQEEYEDQRDEAEYAQAIEDYLNAEGRGNSRSKNVNRTPSVEGGIARLNKGGVPRFQSAGFVSDEDAEENSRVNNRIKELPDPATLYPEANTSREGVRLNNPFTSGRYVNPNTLPRVTDAQRRQYIQHALNFGSEGAAGTTNESSDKLLPPGVTLPNAPAATSIPAASQSPPMQAPFDYEYGKGASLPIKLKTEAGIDTLKDTGSRSGLSGGSGSTSESSTGEKPKSEYDLIREDIMNQREELKRQKQEDKYMAILQAGLGMMSGTSPNALANIGQGASAGIAQYSQSAKQRAAESAAINKGLITAQRYKSMEDIADRTADINEARYKDVLAARMAGAGSSDKEDIRLDRAEKALSDMIKDGAMTVERTLKSEFPLGGFGSDAKKFAERQAYLEKTLVTPNLQRLNSIRQQRYPDLFPSPKASGESRPSMSYVPGKGFVQN